MAVKPLPRKDEIPSTDYGVQGLKSCDSESDIFMPSEAQTELLRDSSGLMRHYEDRS